MPEGPQDQVEPTELPDDALLSAVYEVLSHSDRSALLAALHQHDGSLHLSDAATEIARRTNVQSDGLVTPDQVETKALVLHHLHVPMLTDGGIVERDDAENAIRLTETGEKVADVQTELSE